MSAAPNGIEVEGLVKDFKGGVRAVDGIDLQVAPGEIYGFLGPNGAGKSTTVLVLTTLLPPTAGSARVAGLDVMRHGAEVRRAIGASLAGVGPRPVPDRPRAHAPAERPARPRPRGARTARQRAARAGRPDRGGRPQGGRVLGRHEAAPGPRPRAGARTAPAVPGRAHDGARPAEPRGPVGRGAPPGR